MQIRAFLSNALFISSVAVVAGCLSESEGDDAFGGEESDVLDEDAYDDVDVVEKAGGTCSDSCLSGCRCNAGEKRDCDSNSDCLNGAVCPPDGAGAEYCQASNNNNPPPSGGGRITHVGTTQVWDSDGVNVRINRPSGVATDDLLVLITHRTDSRLPYEQSGWSRVAHCYKVDNGRDCDSNVTSSGRDLSQVVYVKRAANEPSSYTFNFGQAHPAWVILTALRGAATSNPVRDWANTGCDGSPRSVFPSVDGVAGDMVLMSQSFDDVVSKSRFEAPSGASTFGYVSNSDEAGFLFGRVLNSSGRTGSMTTIGAGASSCKDALVTLAIRPR
jgi:hypothetical protein